MKRMIVLIISILIIVGNIIPTIAAEQTDMTSEQENAISMLNYITVLTQEINSSKNSRLFMEEAYSNLVNNTYPNAVDSITLSQLTGLLDTMEAYRMIDVKRERLQFIYDHNKAKAIRSAVPNPMSLFSAISSFSPRKILSSILYMTVDSATSYAAYKEEAELQFLQDGWALDDEEAETLHESRKTAFSYMVRMVNDYDLPGNLTLTESSVDEFVFWKNNDNLVGRIQFLESNRSVYQQYGGYWLTLAESYFQTEDYVKCLEAIEQYEKLDVQIFRRDYDYANVIPLGVSAADELYETEEYVAYAESYLPVMLNNIDNDDWALRYFAAQTYIDLYNRTSDKQFLEEAYRITKDNVNYLVAEQIVLNQTYLDPVKEKSIPAGTKDDEKREIEQYNKMLKEERKTELPPISEPLLLNTELLFAVADQLDISESEKNKIDEILHHNGTSIFLINEVDNQFWFGEHTEDEIGIYYEGNFMVIPAALLSDDSVIAVGVKKKDADDMTIFSDWILSEVKRGTEGDIDTFEAAFTSQEATKYIWEPDSIVVVYIMSINDEDYPTSTFTYATVGTKKDWYDYLKVWEGHKNEWYDYLKVWENSVEFVRIY